MNSGSLLVRQAYKNRVMSTGNLINALIQSSLYKFNLRDASLIISKMGTWLKGLRVETFTELSKEVVDRYLLKSIRPEIIEEIAIHKEKNARLVILSSSLITICEPIARHTGIEDIICSTMEISNGILTGASVGNFCFGREKLIRLIAYCEKCNCDPSEAWYYADSISDLPVLEAVGNPVCVSPDKKLLKIARRMNWRII